MSDYTAYFILFMVGCFLVHLGLQVGVKMPWYWSAVLVVGLVFMIHGIAGRV